MEKSQWLLLSMNVAIKVFYIWIRVFLLAFSSQSHSVVLKSREGGGEGEYIVFQLRFRTRFPVSWCHIVKGESLRGTQQLSPLKYVGNTFYAVQSFLFCALEMHSKRQYKIVIV